MKFGKVDDPGSIDFTLPPDHPDTKVLLNSKATNEKPQLYVGCAKWNKQDLKNFYPRGTKDELAYYSSQFNSIELNATFYRLFPKEQFEKWYEKVPADFRFFPKVTQNISHLKRLINAPELLPEYLDHTLLLKEKLGCIFLQMHNNFQPKNWDRVEQFVEAWPQEVPLAIEFRHTDWFNEETVSQKLYHLLEINNIANVLVDTAGRRDIMHMRMTNSEAFIRFVGANHPSDYERLDDWVDRLGVWIEDGISKIDFFIHQNVEKESPLLVTYFIKKMNKKYGFDLNIPGEDTSNPKLDL
ncbi:MULTISPECIES: DUF72 domain-containing protein [Leeuwenhoekiella]|jgi:uncharacterized protein YecE (DUF72 family)|uniref:DUF72 domain-containing protein n=3 Tax=Leeuwenhoekiella TaxID=283735 RepID=A3XNH8_LEEBM|nr:MULTISPECIES: DUF72 domain-containing protein [Leeuwenhoekiella]EAQ48898.1 hypothetical protein MED217_10127 [Leeuwenhoekiella blandensis MED217]MAO44779.1 DUF72 domain-containing protein [Leeuwenhoekiella sp.]HCW63782.1 DUF72 domain-containing protein [Leeuwenhoekiella sp.]|tara:strand:- start:1429 stop:2322 length:894 start_codon:yes stop_codon:yes gene_type:complete